MTLHQLLDAGLEYAPDYPPSGNSDHLPMALYAMSVLGAGDAELESFAATYRERLVRAPAGEAGDLPAGSGWLRFRGRPGLYRPLRLALAAELREAGSDSVLSRYLPALAPGLIAGAFHPAIRLASAVEADHAGEIAAGLACWMITFESYPVSEQAVDIVAVMQSNVGAESEETRFGERVRSLVADRGYPLGRDDLDAAARVALAVYRGTRNFFALHMVTGTRAARVLSRWADMRAPLTGALLAAHRVLGAPAFDVVQPVPSVVDPEHVIKYAACCAAEYRLTGDETYRQEMEAFSVAGHLPGWVTIPT